jgi:hypothetical protein
MQRVPESRTSEAGFSIIEGLIAAALLLIVTVGVLPLFDRAMKNNIRGNDSTRQANGVTDEIERLAALPFNGGDMSLPDDIPSATVVTDTRIIAIKKLPTVPDRVVSSRWELAADLGTEDVPMSTRERRLTQHAFEDFADNLVFDEPLAASTEDRLVQFKVVDVDIRSSGTAPYAVRVIQAF